MEDWGLPDPPLLLLHVWQWFCDLAERRKPGAALEWGEMESYFALTGERPTRFEIQALCAIDRIALQK